MPDTLDLFANQFSANSEKIRQKMITGLMKVYRKGISNPDRLLDYITRVDFSKHIIEDLGYGDQIGSVLEKYDELARNLMAQKIGMVSAETIERLKNMDTLYYMNHVRDVGVELTKQMTYAVFGGVTEQNIRDTLLNATKSLSEAQIGSLVNTSLRTFDRTLYADTVSDFPEDAMFEYVGGDLIETSRDYCNEWFGQQITYGELMSGPACTNDFGESAIANGGGWNCRHSWKYIGSLAEKGAKEIIETEKEIPETAEFIKFDLTDSTRLEANKDMQEYITNYKIKKEDFGIKDDICKTLSENTGIEYNKVNDFIKSWTGTANESSMKTLLIQKDASEVFGIPLSEFTKSKMEPLIRGIDSEIREKLSIFLENYCKSEFRYTRIEGLLNNNRAIEIINAWVKKGYLVEKGDMKYANLLKKGFVSKYLPSETQKKLLTAMQENTQEYFKSLGYKPTDEIRLYRGVILKEKEMIEGFYPISGNTLESWTTDWKTAKGYAGKYQNGYILEANIKIRDIAGSCLSGFGCSDEYEFVIKNSMIRTVYLHVAK